MLLNPDAGDKVIDFQKDIKRLCTNWFVSDTGYVRF